jgi:hypothetical protein
VTLRGRSSSDGWQEQLEAGGLDVAEARLQILDPLEQAEDEVIGDDHDLTGRLNPELSRPRERLRFTAA